MCMESTKAEEKRAKMLSRVKSKPDREILENRFVYERNLERDKIQRHTEDYHHYINGLNKDVLINSFHIMEMKKLCKEKPSTQLTSIDNPPKRNMISDPKDLMFYQNAWEHLEDPNFSKKALIKKAAALKNMKSDIFSTKKKSIRKQNRRPQRYLDSQQYSDKYLGLLHEKKKLLSKLHTLVGQEENILKYGTPKVSNRMNSTEKISNTGRHRSLPKINALMSARSNDSVATFCDRSQQPRAIKPPSFVPQLKI